MPDPTPQPDDADLDADARAMTTSDPARGISRLTALMIRSNGDDIKCEWARYPSGKYSGWISLWRDGRPHIAPLLDTQPIYDTGEEAEAAMAAIVADIRARPEP